MRKKLKKLKEQRLSFEATFERYGSKQGYKGGPIRTLLFREIKNGEHIVTDHLWFTTNKQFELHELKEGQVILFEARVKGYQKGYKGRREDVYRPSEWDYKLSHPTKIRIKDTRAPS